MSFLLAQSQILEIRAAVVDAGLSRAREELLTGIDAHFRAHDGPGLILEQERVVHVRSRAVTMGKIADIYEARGELDEALRIYEEQVLPVYERLGDVRMLVVDRMYVALYYLRRGHPGDRAAAAELLRLALRDAEAMRIPQAAQIRALHQKHHLA